MDPKDQSATPTSTPQEPAATKKKDPFSLVGKILVGIIIVALLVGGGAFAGQKILKGKPAPASDQVTTSDVTTQTENIEVAEIEGSGEQSTTISSPSASAKTLSGGLTDGSTVFTPYTVNVPAGWEEVTEKSDITDKLILRKGKYELSIYQAPVGGSMCIYPGDEEGNFTQMYEQFEEITGAGDVTYRRSWTEDQNDVIVYNVCQKGEEGNYNSPTNLGGITVRSPIPADLKMMDEIDAIIASLKAK